MRRPLYTFLQAAVLLLMLPAWVGCASTPKIQAMVPNTGEVVFQQTGTSLAVGEVGGGTGSDMWKGSKINGSDVRLALIEALRQSNLFTEVTAEGAAAHTLTATLLTQNQPGVGIGMNVQLTIRYVVTHTATGREVFNERVSSSYTAAFGEALVGATRVRKANEGAVRENIRQLLERLEQVDFE